MSVKEAAHNMMSDFYAGQKPSTNQVAKMVFGVEVGAKTIYAIAEQVHVVGGGGGSDIGAG